ncbi:MAG: hypothetical protein SVS15_01335 [Thermodesulfobacteriota bacterium]|nr:hypothetical protein [Thermodesulfobacteriota bacterium]
MALRIDFSQYLKGLTGAGKTTARDGVFAGSLWAWRFDSAERSARYGRLATPVVQTLGLKLDSLDKALDAFAWPKEDSPWSSARLTTQDSRLDGRIESDIKTGSEAVRFYKYFSRGRDPLSESSLEEETYRFNVILGGEEETLEVTVPAEATWGEVLEGLCEEINNSFLPVQAEVINQKNPYQKIKTLGKTGSILALSVNQAHQDQDLSLKDEKGHMILEMDLEATDEPITAATLGRYGLTANRRADPSTYSSFNFDPRADSGLTAGEHKIKYTLGGHSGTISVAVESDWTWEQVLEKTAEAINSETSLLHAEVEARDRPSGLLDPDTAEGVVLSVTVVSPKLGERLVLEEYGGGWLSGVDSFFDPQGTLPANPQTGDRYIASATGNGWTEDYIYEYDGSSWVETAPATYNAVHVEDVDQDYFYGSSGWSTTNAGNLLEDLGLTSTAHPGSDAELTVNSEAYTTETGVFTQDQGRLTLEVTDSFAETLPLRVVSAMEEIEERFGDVVQAYNDLRSFLLPNEDLFKQGFAQGFREPVEDNLAELSWLGVTEATEDKMLWVDKDKFWSALGQDPEKAEELIYSATDALIPALKRASARARDPEVSANLVSPTLLEDVSVSAETQFRVEKREALQEVVDAGAGTGASENPFLESTGIIRDVYDAREKALTGEADLEGTSRIIKTTG